MRRNSNKAEGKFDRASLKVMEVTKDHYTLENGDVFEHTFDIDETISCEEFQRMLDNARSIIRETISRAESGSL